MEVDVSDHTNGFTDEMGKDGSSLRPVAPCASGQGLPYAPVDWPSPGDIWTWKVANQVKPSGFYTHRYLLVPKRLQKIPTRKIWLGSKLATTRYLESEFPEADIGAFFASFTWDIPAEVKSETQKKAKKSPTPKKRPSTPKARSSTPKKRPSSQRDVKIKEPESGIQYVRITRNSAKRGASPTTQDTTTSKDVHLSAHQSKHGTANKKDKAFHSHVTIVQNAPDQPALDCLPRNSKSLADRLAEMNSEEFELYLNSLDDNLFESVPQLPNAGAQMEDFTNVRKELSSLLAIDLPGLIISKKLPEVKSLASKLQSDPHLSREEHSMLNLIQEIPLISKDFLATNQVTAESSMANITSHKIRYMSCKEKLAVFQAEDATASSAIQEIDAEMAKLQSRRAKLAKAVKRNQKKIAELVSSQNQVFDSVFKIVDDDQMKGAFNQDAEVFAKFAPLRGFSFRR